MTAEHTANDVRPRRGRVPRLLLFAAVGGLLCLLFLPMVQFGSTQKRHIEAQSYRR